MAQEPKQMTLLELATLSMFGVFMKNDDGDGKMTKKEFSKMLKSEMPSFTKDASVDTDSIFSDFDFNKDGYVDFSEFALLVCKLATVQYTLLQELSKCQEQQKAKE